MLWVCLSWLVISLFFLFFLFFFFFCIESDPLHIFKRDGSFPVFKKVMVSPTNRTKAQNDRIALLHHTETFINLIQVINIDPINTQNLLALGNSSALRNPSTIDILDVQL